MIAVPVAFRGAQYENRTRVTRTTSECSTTELIRPMGVDYNTDSNAVMNSNTNRSYPVTPDNSGTNNSSVSEMKPRMMYNAYEVIIPVSKLAIC